MYTLHHLQMPWTELNWHRCSRLTYDKTRYYYSYWERLRERLTPFSAAFWATKYVENTCTTVYLRKERKFETRLYILYPWHGVPTISPNKHQLSLSSMSTHLKLTIPSASLGACHMNVILWKFSLDGLLWAMEAMLLAPTGSQGTFCWLLFCGMNCPSSMLFWPGTWAITKNPRNVFIVPVSVTTWKVY